MREGAPEGACVVTDDQFAGRGRAGRVWHADPATNLTLSLILRPRLPRTDWPIAGLAAAVAVARTLERFAPDTPALVKWPNDVLLGGRKVAGLLLETVRTDEADAPALIVGIGLNVNQARFPDDIEARATSLHGVTGHPQDRGEVFAALLNTLEPLLNLCVGSGVGLLLRLYAARLDGLGGTVTFYETASSLPVRGRLTGLTPTGALQIATEEGLRTFHAGDLTTHTR